MSRIRPSRILNLYGWIVQKFPNVNKEPFVSEEQTATGSSQDVAHGLGGTPTRVLVVPTAGHDGSSGAGTQAPTITEGQHDETNVKATVTAGAKFKVYAWA